MITIRVETRIAAPRELCFDLARDVDIHMKTSDFTEERTIPPGRTSGLVEQGDLIILEARHLGVRQRLAARITMVDRPNRFVDEMIAGAFQSLRHVHDFNDDGDGTLMIDTIEWR